jgi:hypothetical protein
MNLGSILGSISPIAGIASGNGLFGKLLGGHHGGGGQPPAVPDPSASVPQPAGPPPTQPAPPAATPNAAPKPEQMGGMHGVAFGGKPNMQGILASLQMMAPRRF